MLWKNSSLSQYVKQTIKFRKKDRESIDKSTSSGSEHQWRAFSLANYYHLSVEDSIINTQVTNSTLVVKDFSLSLLAANDFIFMPSQQCNIWAWSVFCSHQLWALRVNYLPLLTCVVDEVTWHGTRPPFPAHPSPTLLPIDDPFRIYDPAVVLHISCQGVTDPFANLDFNITNRG